MTLLPLAQLFDLRGKSALVTGGAVGIGRGIALRLAEAGASVMIGDRNLDAAADVVAEIRQAGGSAAALRANIADVVAVQALVRETAERFDGLDIVVNNAGIFPFSPCLQTPEALWDSVLDVNLKGAFFCAQAAARQMLERDEGGVIINIASIDAMHPTGNLAHYDASKGGLVMLTKALALELGPRKIRVNAIAPGAIQTPGAAAGMPSGSMTPAQLKALTETFTARIPLRRQGQPDDIAAAALFLSSDAAAYITGATLVVDGGYLLS